MNIKWLWASYALLVCFCFSSLLAPSYLSDVLLVKQQNQYIEERADAIALIEQAPITTMDSDVVAELLKFELEQSERHLDDTKTLLELQFILAAILGGLLTIHLASLLYSRSQQR